MSAQREAQRMDDRAVRRASEAANKAIRTGVWPPWREAPPPSGSKGWLSEVAKVHHNTVFSVLVRTFWADGIGTMTHAAISTTNGADIAWRDKQRIKNELFGEDALAVEVYPRTVDLIDRAPMFHLWIYPIQVKLPFGLHKDRRDRDNGK